MKNLRISIKIFIIFISILFVTNFCKKERPECERTNTGYVRVTNGTSFLIYVDITSVKLGFNSQRPLYPYESTTYTMPEGTVYCYAASMTNYSANKWNEKIETCTQCQGFTLTWTSGGKGDTDNGSNVAVYMDSKNIDGKAKR